MTSGEIIGQLVQNRVLWVPLVACGLAQVAKVVLESLRHGKLSLSSLFQTGGMPSSHSALVSALAVEVGQTQGWYSSQFAIATVFAVIVMYDAAGLRQAAGNQARTLNRLLKELKEDHPQLPEVYLKESLGHTGPEVIGGWGLGMLCSWGATLAAVLAG